MKILSCKCLSKKDFLSESFFTPDLFLQDLFSILVQIIFVLWCCTISTATEPLNNSYIKCLHHKTLLFFIYLWLCIYWLVTSGKILAWGPLVRLYVLRACTCAPVHAFHVMFEMKKGWSWVVQAVLLRAVLKQNVCCSTDIIVWKNQSSSNTVITKSHFSQSLHLDKIRKRKIILRSWKPCKNVIKPFEKA